MPQLRIRRVQRIGKVLSFSELIVFILCFVLCEKSVSLRRIFLELAIAICIMEELMEFSAIRHYDVHNMSLTIGSEVEIAVQKSDQSWNRSAHKETYVLEEDSTPVWPGGPPPWWENDYAGDIYENLKKSENEYPDIGFESPNLYDRPNLVNYICQVADAFGMTNATKFLAVRLLDGYMDKHSIITSRLKLMALACLSISCEFSYNVNTIILNCLIQ